MADGLDITRATSRGAQGDSISLVLEAARSELGLELAFVAQVGENEERLHTVSGDPAAFGATEADGLRLLESYCRQVLEAGRSEIVADTSAGPRARSLAARHAGIGAWVAVPVVLSDGSIFGTLCCAGSAPHPELPQRDVSFLRVLARLVASHIEAAEREQRARRLLVGATSVRALVVALETRDGYTGWHSDSVLKLCGAVALQLGLPPEQVACSEQVALLHDIGKIGIPDAVLQKPGPLDDEEWAIMRRHPDIGAEVVRSVEGLSHLAPAIAAEHERWDGRGYPRGLAGDRIPIESRIVLVCDAYHAMISERPYRKPIPLIAALREIKMHAGSQFCPDAARALLAVADLDNLADLDAGV